MAKAFDDELFDVEQILSQFECPTHVAAPPAPRTGKPSTEVQQVASADRKLTRAEVVELQRRSSERLSSGSSFEGAAKLPRRPALVPPAKQLDARLTQLRADPAAREA